MKPFREETIVCIFLSNKSLHSLLNSSSPILGSQSHTFSSLVHFGGCNYEIFIHNYLLALVDKTSGPFNSLQFSTMQELFGKLAELYCVMLLAHWHIIPKPTLSINYVTPSMLAILFLASSSHHGYPRLNLKI